MFSNTTIDQQRISDFCQKWGIGELSVFGSALRDDFGPDSDIDLLASFQSNMGRSIFDHLKMQDELAEIFDRKVDLASKSAVERSSNWIRKEAILSNAKSIYAER